ncbi:hypothetical protein ED733_004364 [Metarhizium rileyi]|uniref:DUF7732 domain-containing protein n=1 Tax=Metarhizium rileyi (strain RCEF 4871) TaxID=1649241 RepID=A0A5C6GG27_METRR|nr:hypothetical protein ED733_004364 [Metarhizium rileyi]
MRLDFTLFAAVLLSSTAANILDPQHAAHVEAIGEENNDLFKRKGGGGGVSGGGFRANTGPGSNLGGTSRGGSGPSRRFGGGSYYGGGAATPYRSGAATALGIGALAFTVGALAFWPGLWLHGANLYPYRNQFSFHNGTTNKTESLPVVCGCGKYEVCGCDENNTTMTELVGNGTYEALNQSVITVGNFKGRKSFLVNGTLPNGTTADGPDEGSNIGVGVGMKSLVEAAGMWPALAAVVAAIFLA